MFEFTETGKLSGFGRTGTLATPHGTIKTPVYMPVGTQATVKSLSPADLEQLGAQIILANNYHLYLRPGSENVQKLGGLHHFMQWSHPILTDSGGFQMQSLSAQKVGLCKITDEGARFKSHIDGSIHFLTPEAATISQIQIGADIIMAFDDSTPADATRKRAEIALKRTNDWLLRCIAAWKNSTEYQHIRDDARSFQPTFAARLSQNSNHAPASRAGENVDSAQDLPKESAISKQLSVAENKSSIPKPQALFGIIQGGNFPDLRKASAEFVIAQDLPGIALGGASIGREANETAENIAMVRELLPKNKPIYAMGVGVKPSDAVSVIKAGADMFDCVSPTRLARCGQLYNLEAKSEYIDIAKSMFALDTNPIDNSCDCYTCQTFTRAYLHHLFKSRELLYYRLASTHNLRMMIITVEKYINSRSNKV